MAQSCFSCSPRSRERHKQIAMRHALSLCLALLFAPLALPAVAADRPLTLLISIDGFRADYLDRGVTPVLSRLAAGGARGMMRPSFPSLTFPNHYTLVTGLRPDRNGIVDNNMEDPGRPGIRFSMSKLDVSHDPFWWDQAEPLWVTAERAGLRTATMFWPGSDLPVRGVRPRDWKMYDKAFLADARVDQVLAWLDRPAARRPRFVTLYFDEVDTWGHNAGPDSEELNAALARTDASVGRLLEGLKARGLFAATNLIVVADHGMAPISQDRVSYLEDLLPASAYQFVGMGPVASLRAAPGHEDEVAKALLSPHDHFTCWRKAELPARFHYGENPRVQPIICLAQTGWVISTDRAFRVGKGAHGFDPDDPLMAALFVARGPAFRRGVVLAPFDNVDVYPLLARLVGVTPRPNDGDLDQIRAGLAR